MVSKVNKRKSSWPLRGQGYSDRERNNSRECNLLGNLADPFLSELDGCSRQFNEHLAV